MIDPGFEHKTYRFLLKSGKAVLVRRITPDDKKRIQDGFQLFSPRSRYMRFFSHIRKLTQSQLAYLTEIDYENHSAWGAMLEDDHDQGVGIARYVRLQDEQDYAEIAISVIDPYQQQGVGTILLAALFLSAHLRGISQFRSYLLKENSDLIESLRNLGGELDYRQKGVYEINLPLSNLVKPYTQSSTAVYLEERVLEFIRQFQSQK